VLVVDTNIAVYLFLESYANERAAALLRLDNDWHSEQFLLTELVNVLARTVRAGRLERDSGSNALAQITSFFNTSLHDVSNEKTFALALDLGISGYDARYVALATSLGVRLITEDRKLRAAVPEWTESLDEAIERLEADA
jgi:predicted nucleic acid-binding protein